MSHFTMAVIAKDEQELKDKLQPYHEYECTGTLDEYVVRVPEPFFESLKNYWEYYIRKRDFIGFGKFMKDWNGAERRGLWFFRLTNPNRKWDWWQIGGRWTGALIAKNGVKGIRGRPGLMTDPSDGNRYDSLLIKDIDFDAMDADWDKEEKHWRTWGFIDKEGTWNEKGVMGWFGVSWDEKAEWSKIFKAWRDSLLPEDRIWVIDCHI